MVVLVMWRDRRRSGNAESTDDTGADPVVPPRPADPEPAVTPSPAMDEPRVRRILDVALRIGQVLLSCQAGTADVAATVAAVAAAYGLPAAQVDITANSISVSVPRGVPGAPVTAIFLAQARALDYSRLQCAIDLAQRVVDTTPEPEQVQAQLDGLERAPHPYPRWVSTIALGVMAGGFSVLCGAGAPVAVIAVATTSLIDRVNIVLNRWHLPLLFQQVVAAALATGVTVGLAATGWLPADAAPALVVASNIMALLSGLATVGSVQDAVTGYQLTAISRMMDIVVSSVGILVGALIALHIGRAAGVHVVVIPDMSLVAVLSLPVRALAGAVGAAGAAIASYAPLRAALPAAVAGATGSLLYFGMQIAGAGNVAGSFVAATAIGLAAALAGERMRVPPLMIVTDGIVPLVPGLTLFRGFVELVYDQTGAGLAFLGVAAETAMALGAGAVFGPLLASPARHELARYRSHLRGGRWRPVGGEGRIPQLAGVRLPWSGRRP